MSIFPTEEEIMTGLKNKIKSLEKELEHRELDLIKLIKESFKPLSEKDKEDNWYLAECPNCGWWGSSRLCGGGQIADTGDYGSCSCPICYTECDGKEEQKQISDDEIDKATKKIFPKDVREETFCGYTSLVDKSIEKRMIFYRGATWMRNKINSND